MTSALVLLLFILCSPIIRGLLHFPSGSLPKTSKNKSGFCLISYVRNMLWKNSGKKTKKTLAWLANYVTLPAWQIYMTSSLFALKNSSTHLRTAPVQGSSTPRPRRFSPCSQRSTQRSTPPSSRLTTTNATIYLSKSLTLKGLRAAPRRPLVTPWYSMGYDWIKNNKRGLQIGHLMIVYLQVSYLLLDHISCNLWLKKYSDSAENLLHSLQNLLKSHPCNQPTLLT